jgi:hypothetical protein
MVIGILLLILGNRRITRKEKQKMNTENMEVKGKSLRIWGWISSIIGGLFTLWGIAWMVIAIVNYLGHDSGEILGIELSIFLCFLGLVVGIPLLILRIRLLFRNEQVESFRVWGLVLTIVGVLFIVGGISWFLFMYGKEVHTWLEPGSIDYSIVFFLITPLPAFGVLFLVFGIRDLFLKGK